MAKRFPMEQWQDVADNYNLPVSLLGTISNHILTPKHKSLKMSSLSLKNIIQCERLMLP